jgi:hypothetical protein
MVEANAIEVNAMVANAEFRLPYCTRPDVLIDQIKNQLGIIGVAGGHLQRSGSIPARCF